MNIPLSADRTKEFRRNALLEDLLADVNADLAPGESQLVEHYLGAKMEFPLVLILGPLRSGTTLFMQWLAGTGMFAYPTNLLSRFYAAPIIGARLQLLLTHPRYRFRDEIEAFSLPVEFRSDNGKTSGALSPNEFWYFWRRFLPDATLDAWSDATLQSGMDTETMKAELVGLMDVFQLPFAAKGMLFNYNIRFLDSVFEKVLFIRLQRDPVANVASVLDARERQYGDKRQWYSFKIPEYESLQDEEPLRQAAGQVAYINKAISGGLRDVDETRQLSVVYEDFCKNPRAIFEELGAKIGAEVGQYSGPASFARTRERAVPDSAAIEKALRRYA